MTAPNYEWVCLLIKEKGKDSTASFMKNSMIKLFQDFCAYVGQLTFIFLPWLDTSTRLRHGTQNECVIARVKD